MLRVLDALGGAAVGALAVALLAGAAVFLFGWRRVRHGQVLEASLLGLLALIAIRRLGTAAPATPWGRVAVGLARGCEMLLLAAGTWFLWSEAARVLFPGDR